MRAMQPRQASKWPTHVSLMVAAPSAIPAAQRIHLLVPRHVCGAHGQAEAAVRFRRPEAAVQSAPAAPPSDRSDRESSHHHTPMHSQTGS